MTSPNGTIGRASLDGTGANQSLIAGATLPCGVAVDALPSPPSPPSNEFTLGKPKLNKKRGTANLPLTVHAPGELSLSGNGVMAARAVGVNAVHAQGVVRLLIKAKGAKRRKLNETGKVTVKPKITYTPNGGNPRTQAARLTLRKR